MISSPYKGLVPYAEEDAAYFFGRESEQDIIAANLQAYRLTLLYGASGVGKSSVLRAGVASHLRQLPGVAVVVFSAWRDDPIGELTRRVRAAVANASPAGAAAVHAEGASLGDALAAWTTQFDTDLLIILDQFEEYFLYHPSEDGEGTFTVEFPRAVSRAGLRANFLVSIREDALAQVDRFKGRIPNLFDNYLRLDHLDRDAARSAVEKPLARFNEDGVFDAAVSIDPALVEAVLTQVRTGQVVLGEAGRGRLSEAAPEDGRIEAPYLQLVMTRLWREERAAGSHVLRLETLNRLGGADRIVRTHLDEVMNALMPTERRAAAQAFRYLVTPSGTKIAHTVADLADYAGVPQARLEPMMEKLSSGDVRIVRPIAPSPGRPTVARFEIFHDVLAPAILDWRQRSEVLRREQMQYGLAPLHGAASSLINSMLASSVLIVTPLAILMLDDPDDPFATARWMLVGVGLLGIVVLTKVVTRVLRLHRSVATAARLGFQWRWLADAMVDRRGDFGALISGAFPYSRMDSRDRDRVRLVRRVAAAALIVAVLVWPLVGLFTTVVLGSHHLMEPEGAPVVLVGPTVVFLLVTLLARAWEYRFLRGRRDAAAKAGDAVNDPFDALDADQPLPASPVYVRRIKWLLQASMLALGAMALLSIAIIGFGPLAGGAMWQTITPGLLRAEISFRATNPGRQFRLPVDPSISPLDAGRAYYTVSYAGDPPQLGPNQYGIPRQLESWLPELENSPFGGSRTELEGLISRAGKFTPDERAYLERVASHPGFAESEVLARAGRLDYLAARLMPSHSYNLWTAPISLLPMRDLGHAHLAKAAVELSKGRPEDAEATLRQAVSIGLAMMDNAHHVVEALIGANVVQLALKGLEDVYTITGQDAPARTLRLARDTAEAAAKESDLGDLTRAAENLSKALSSFDIPLIRQTALGVLTDPNRVPGLRWEFLQVMALAPCTNARELVFGPTPRLSEVFQRTRRELTRFKSEEQLFDNMVALPHTADPFMKGAPTGMTDSVVITLLRTVASTFGNEHISGCVRMLWEGT